MQKFLEAIENDEEEQSALPETTRLTERSTRSNKSHLSNLRKSKSFDGLCLLIVFFCFYKNI